MEEQNRHVRIKLADQQLIAVKYWWEDNDFVFITDQGEEYRCANASISINYDDRLDYSSEVMIEITKKYVS